MSIKGHLVFVVVSLALLSCGKEDPVATAAGKALFSKWDAADGSKTLQLGVGSFATFSSSIDYPDFNHVCDATFTFGGDTNTGTALISSSTFRNNGQPDPGCAALNGTYTFTRTNTTLTLCKAGVCEGYR